MTRWSLFLQTLSLLHHFLGLYSNGSDLRSLSGSFEPAHLYSQTAEIDFSPSISPDGARVAYTTLRYATGALAAHTYEIATQAIDGSDRLRLTNNGWNDVSPAWSPDGSRIAFVSRREDGPRVFTIAPDGSNERSIAPSVQAQRLPPVWAPDGSRVAFVGEEVERGSLQWIDTYSSTTRARGEQAVHDEYIVREVIYTASLDGSGLRKIGWYEGSDYAPQPRQGWSGRAAPEADVTGFRWSPDGRYIAFAGRLYGYDDGIYVASADGSDVREVFNLVATVTDQEPD